MKVNKFLPVFCAMVMAAIFGAKAQQWDGYTLYSVQNSTAAYLVDTNGTTYHTWSGLSGGTGYSSYLRPGGNLIRTVMNTSNSFSGGGITGRVQEVDYNGTLVWDYVYSTTQYCMHHDICPMPNGNVLLISYELKTATEVTAAGSSTSHVMWPDKIVEVQPSGTNGGNIVWEWHAWDHLVQNVDATKNNYQTSIVNHPELLNINYNNTSNTKDWMHMNGIDYNPVLDLITFSSHFLNEVYVIDHSTTIAEAASHSGGHYGHGGDLLYRWGNPAAYGATGTQVIHTVHDAHWVPQDCPHANYIGYFNNDGVSSSQSAADLINPPFDPSTGFTSAGGVAYLPSTYSVRYPCNGHSSNMGNHEQYPNGNTMVCVAMSGLIYEIDSTGTLLWSKTVSGTVPQAHRYTSCYISGTTTQPTISENGGILESSAGNSYQWYENGVLISGATSSTYEPTHDGLFEVQTIDANGCRSALSASYTFIMTGISDESFAKNVSLYPNPSTGFVHIGGVYASDVKSVIVTDLQGKVVLETKNTNDLELSNVKNGLYSVRIQTSEHVSVKKVNIVR